jgi:hypothetical protein
MSYGWAISFIEAKKYWRGRSRRENMKICFDKMQKLVNAIGDKNWFH